MIGNKNSTDLDVGRRPKLKSDEFLLPIIEVIELTSLLCLKPPKKVLQLLAARPPSGVVSHTNRYKHPYPSLNLKTIVTLMTREDRGAH